MSFQLVYETKNDAQNCCYKGYSFDKQFVLDHFPNEVRKILIDAEGTNDLVEEFGTLNSTGFDETALVKIFKLSFTSIEPWRIGEAFGEFFLTEEFKVRFWYNHLRDLKNPKASDTGTDLVGFIDVDQETLFVFGEVKTSDDKNSPPNVVYGRTGLKKQIAALCSNREVVSNLVRYLAFKVYSLSESDPFRVDFEKALTAYLKSHKRIQLMGILVRDTPVNENDLKSRYDEYKHKIDKDMIIEFLCLYVPVPIKNFSSTVNIEEVEKYD